MEGGGGGALAEALVQKLAQTALLAQRERECRARMGAGAAPGAGAADGRFCPVEWDSVSCWPATPAGALAVVPCVEELNHIRYDTTQNATKWCFPNGTWRLSDYEQCREIVQEAAAGGGPLEVLFFVGFCLSLVAVALAVWIFLYFKDLRCLRNTIHTNLMVTYIFYDATWILNVCLKQYVWDPVYCSALSVLQHYFYLTNFFWMFIEGLYLFLLVVATFTGEKVKLHIYIVVGWGIPAVIVVTWAVAKHFGQSWPPGNELESKAEKDLRGHCLWMAPDHFDWIHQAPVIAVLCVNLVFLVSIMWVLITKLRSANTAETQQYRKATKALLVLFPLLGITYILMLHGPGEGTARSVFNHTQALLLGMQGFTVALFYCFLNTEVQHALRHRLGRWREARAVGGGRRYTLSHSKDWSPRSRTESIRLGDLPYGGGLLGSGGSPYHKRESTASATTTTTLLLGPPAGAGAGAGSGNGRLPNGAGAYAVRAAHCPLLPAGEDAV